MAVTKDFNITLDVKRSVSNTPFELVEGDNANRIFVTLTDDGKPVDLTGCLVLAVFSKSDGHTAQQDNDGNGITMDDEQNNAFLIELYNTSFAPGLVECEVQILSGENQDKLITSAKFNFNCRRSIMNADTILSTDEYPILVDLIDRTETAEQGLLDIDANEETRQSNELERIANEDERQAEELERVAAETLRDGAEEARIFNETAREALFQKWLNPTASAVTLLPTQEAIVSVQLQEGGVSYSFGIPQGKGFDALGVFDTVAQLQAAYPSPTGNPMAFVGVAPDMYVYLWDGAWKSLGAVAVGPAGPNLITLDTQTSLAGLLKGNGTSVLQAAQGVDYAPPASNLEATLAVAGWTGTEAPYTQTVSVTGVTATNNVIVSPAPAAFDAWGEAKVRCTTQGEGTLTFACETVPEVDLTANILIVG